MNFRDKSEKLDFGDVLIVPKASSVHSRKDVTMEVTYENVFGESVWTGIPIVAANMDSIGTFKVASELSEFKMPTFLSKFYTVEDYKKNDYDPEHVGVSTGISKEDIENTIQILKYNQRIKFVCIDIANGYLDGMLLATAELKRHCKGRFLVSGNVVTREGKSDLNRAGASVVKVGIGSGSVCLTRNVAGVGIPQLSAIDECASSDSEYPIMSDGGCASSGDISKAFIAGANYVMIAGMLAGHEETSTEFYGMSSTTAMDRHYGKQESYKASEGKAVLVPYRGPLKHTVSEILGGIRSTCTYVGCDSLSKMIGNPSIEFIKVKRQLNGVFS